MAEPTSDTPEWREVPGWHHYLVSSDGRVKSLPRKTTGGGLLRTHHRRRDGYAAVALYQNGSSRTVLVHEIVAAAFHGPRPAGAYIRHLDGDPANNSVTNLAYGTPSENGADMVRHGRGHVAKTHCPHGHAYDEANTYRRPDGGRDCIACRTERQRRYAAGERGRRTHAAPKPARPARTPEPDLPGETWRPIPGFADYEASSAGRIRSLPHPTARGIRGGRILKPGRTGRMGYLSVAPCTDGVVRQRYVHQLVALAFLGPSPEAAEVRHLDGDPANNCAGNLRYGSRSENRDDQRRHGTHPMAARTECGNGHPWTEENTITRYWPDGRFKQRVCRICLAAWRETARSRRASAA